jgi:Holliday junction resolvase
MSPRRAAHIDHAQKDIVATLQQLGCVVIKTTAVGDGFPDLVVVLPDGQVVLVEIKTPPYPECKPDQLELMLKLVSPAYRIWMMPEQAIRAAQKLIC